jgi:hypothetical protein
VCAAREAVGTALGEAMGTAVRQAVGTGSSRYSNSRTTTEAAEGFAENAAARLASFAAPEVGAT